MKKFKRISKVSLQALFFSFAFCSCSTGIPQRPEKIKQSDLSFNIPQVEQWTLSNGLEVFFKQNDELPKISGVIVLPGGSAFEPVELAGLASASGELLRDGGVKGISPAALDKELDELAASIDTSYDVERGSLSFSSLSEDFSRVLELSVRILTEPAFDQERFKLWKTQALEGIERRKEDPSTMAGMISSELLYGKGSQLSHFVSKQSISRLDVKQLREFAARNVRPRGAILAITGAISREKLAPMLEQAFTKWQNPKNLTEEELKVPELSAITHRPQPGVYVLQKDFDQAAVIMQHLGPPMFTPDMYEMSVFNRLYGANSLSSTLMNEIRTKLGLAYDVGGGIAPGRPQGSIVISLATKNDSVPTAIRRVLDITSETIKAVPKSEAFSEARAAVLQSFVFAFNDPAEVVSRRATQKLWKYPADYDRTYLSRMSAVTPEMVQAVGQKWVKPEQLLIVVVGRIDVPALRKALPEYPVREVQFDTEPMIP